MKTSPVAPERDAADASAAWCGCGASRTDGAHPLCVGPAAVHHSARVEVQAGLLLSRLRAIHLMGTMNGELQPLSAAR